MNRLGLLHPSTLDGKHMTETRSLYDAMSRYSEANYDKYFTMKLASTGALVGSFGILLHTPALGRAHLDIASALHGLQGLKPRTRSIVIFTVASHEKAMYHLYSQAQIAQADRLTPVEISTLLARECPRSLDLEETAAFNMAVKLCTSTGPIPQPVWDAAVGSIGRDGALAVVHYVGYHRYVATLLRGFDAQLPAESDRVEGR